MLKILNLLKGRAAGSRTQPKCSQSTCTTDILQPVVLQLSFILTQQISNSKVSKSHLLPDFERHEPQSADEGQLHDQSPQQDL